MTETVLRRVAGERPDVAQSRVLAVQDHRPWPLPDAPWVMAQSWTELLFAHWPVDAEALRAHVPAGLAIDTFAGQAYIGITPFQVTGLRARGLPPVPGLSRFPELNVRTYVTRDERPGIWFLSLDAGSSAAVLGARSAYGLPYFRADMTIERGAGGIRYTSARRRGDARLHVEYGPAGAPAETALERWLTERYRLYTERRGRLWSADIHHPPWPLQHATATVQVNTMSPVALPAGEPLLHYSHRQDVLIWPPARV